jgi:carotenoid cleavage dioxygenase
MGTNIQFNPTTIRLHAFAGAGMVHQVQIHKGRATYSNFYVRTPRFEIERTLGREIFLDFSDIAGGGGAALAKLALLQSRMQKGILPAMTQYELTPGSTSIRHHAGRLYCLQETGYAFVLDARMNEEGLLLLDGRGRLETWEGEWEGPFSAHPRFDPDTGDMYNISLDQHGTIRAGLITNGLRNAQAAIHDSKGKPMSWLHDFFLTENHLVFPDISMRGNMTGLQGPNGSIFEFDHSYPLRWGVVPRDFKEGAQVQWFPTQRAGTIWHVINAWEEKGPDGSRRIILYSPVFDDYPPDVPIHTPAEPHAKVKTWTLNLDSGAVVNEELLIEHAYERPSFNLAYNGRPNRYCYLLDEYGDGYMGKGVLKYDLFEKKEIAYFSYGELYGGEAYFVPKKHPQAEDDGYLLDLLMGEHRAELIIIDASSMQELARLHLPQRVPFGVHATWISQEEALKLQSI